jgi:pimeloyl-ACP methyl ester carboxylesterase
VQTDRQSYHSGQYSIGLRNISEGVQAGVELTVCCRAGSSGNCSNVSFNTGNCADCFPESGCSLSPIPGIGNRILLTLIFGLYRPFQNIPWLVRVNARQFGVPKTYEASFADDTRSLSPTMLARVVSSSQTFRLPLRVKGVNIPTLIAVGEKELGTVKRSAKDLGENLPNARAYEVVGQTHVWPISNPRLCASAIRAFLSGDPLPSGLRLM